MAEWLKATDCKSVLARVRWFESTPAQVYQEGANPLFQWMRTTQTDRFVIGSSDVRAECGANFAFGGGWGGSQGVDLEGLPQEYVIDYVKVYR